MAVLKSLSWLVRDQGLGKVFHSSCWLGDLSGLGDELEWSQRQGLGKVVVSGVWLGVMGAWSLRILG